MAISQNITPLSTPPSRSDPTNFDSRADTFLADLPTLATQINTWAGQANSTAASTNGDAGTASAAAASATQASATATTQSIAATSAAAATAQALSTVAGETASVVAHAAAGDPHPLLDGQLVGAAAYALDLIGVIAKAVSGGRAAFIGGSAATPAITIGNAGIYQSASNTLSVALGGVEVLRVTATGIQCVGGSVTSL